MLNPLLRTLVLSASLLVGACAPITDALQEWGTVVDDRISAVLMMPNGNDLVVIGERHHYVLQDLDPGLLAALAHKDRRQFHLRPPSLSLSKDGAVTGEVVIQVSDPIWLGSEIQAQLKAAGYQGDNALWQRSYPIKGQAYQPAGTLAGLPQPLNKRYFIRLQTRESRWQRGIKLPLTPVAVTADVGINMAGVALVVAAYPIICLFNEMRGRAGGFCSVGG